MRVNERLKTEIAVCLNAYDASGSDEVKFYIRQCTSLSLYLSLAYILRAMIIIQFAWSVILINSLVIWHAKTC